jgi:hypothetical protein
LNAVAVGLSKSVALKVLGPIFIMSRLLVITVFFGGTLSFFSLNEQLKKMDSTEKKNISKCVICCTIYYCILYLQRAASTLQFLFPSSEGCKFAAFHFRGLLHANAAYWAGTL